MLKQMLGSFIIIKYPVKFTLDSKVTTAAGCDPADRTEKEIQNIKVVGWTAEQ